MLTLHFFLNKNGKEPMCDYRKTSRIFQLRYTFRGDGRCWIAFVMKKKGAILKVWFPESPFSVCGLY